MPDRFQNDYWLLPLNLTPLLALLVATYALRTEHTALHNHGLLTSDSPNWDSGYLQRHTTGILDTCDVTHNWDNGYLWCRTIIASMDIYDITTDSGCLFRKAESKVRDRTGIQCRISGSVIRKSVPEISTGDRHCRSVQSYFVFR